MNLPNIAQHLRRNPDAYLRFGPWWWSVKAHLRPVFDFGPTDDPATRALMDANAPKGDVMRAAMRHYQASLAGFLTPSGDLPDGRPYVLSDPDMTATAAL